MTGGTAEEDRHDVARVLAGDVEAFAVLVDRHQGRIVSHLTRMVGRSDAKDLAQDTFVRAYQAIERFDSTYPFRGWLLVIASRLAANHVARRRERRYGEHSDQALSSDDPARQVADADAVDALQRRLDHALDQLSPDSRVLYELRFRQQLSPAELANHFDISENALKVRVHRLRAQLAARLGLTLDGDAEVAKG
ncbi:MAG TPA: sigma-70 family RNA polymerase sigma factor [Planctomycetota bacterium]|nr:sigma-70 family RNA polymerase sigma factor [Planctomycetota bacterium]